MDANRIPEATHFAKILKVNMQMYVEMSQEGVLFMCGGFLRGICSPGAGQRVLQH